MHQISGNKNPMGSIEVPVDREYPNEELVKFPLIATIAIHFSGCGWSSTRENAK
jgi:hypothetical protein